MTGFSSNDDVVVLFPEALARKKPLAKAIRVALTSATNWG
jgi:hypothetical protein